MRTISYFAPLRLCAFALMLYAVSLPAQTPVAVYENNFIGGNNTNFPVTWHSLQRVQLGNGMFIMDQPNITTATNGGTTNLLWPGLYNLSFQGVPIVFPILVPATGALVNAANCVVSNLGYFSSTNLFPIIQTNSVNAGSNVTVLTNINGFTINVPFVQPASAVLSNVTAAGLNAFQATNANLTGWSLTPTNAYQPTNANLSAFGQLTTNAFQQTNVNLGGYAQLPTNTFQPSNANLSAFGLLTTNAFQTTNANLGGYAQLPTNTFQPSNANLSAFGLLTTNAFQTTNVNLGGYAQLPTNTFQPSNANLSAFGLLTTNAFQTTNVNLGGYAQLPTNTFQPSNANLSAFGLLTTNAFQTTNVNLGGYSLLPTNTFQPSNANLSAFGLLTTNAFQTTNVNLGGYAQLPTNTFQPSNANLSAFGLLTTNAFQTTNVNLGGYAQIGTNLFAQTNDARSMNFTSTANEFYGDGSHLTGIIGSGSGSQTPLTNNANGAGFGLTNLAAIQSLVISNGVMLTGSNATFFAVTSSNGFIGAATSATNLTGSFAGNVTGTQGATVVASVGSASLPAAQLTGTHTTPDSVLSTNIPLRNAANSTNSGVWYWGNITQGEVTLDPQNGIFFSLANNTYQARTYLDPATGDFIFGNTDAATGFPTIHIESATGNIDLNPDAANGGIIKGTGTSFWGGPSNTFTGPSDFRSSLTNRGETVIGNFSATGTITGNGSGLTSIPFSSLTGVNTNQYTLTNDTRAVNLPNAANTITGIFAGIGSALTSIPYSALVGINTNLYTLTNDTRAVSLTNVANVFTGIHKGDANNLTNLPIASVNGLLTNTYLQNLNGTGTNFTGTGTNILSGVVAYPEYTISSVGNGNNSAVNLGSNTFINLAGASAAVNLCGLNAAGAISGRLVTFVFTNGFPLTILNDSSLDPTFANRFYTGTGASMVITNTPAIFQAYWDANLQHWLLPGTWADGGAGSFSGFFNGTNTGTFGGNGGALTNLNGAKIQAATLSSNAFDAPTAAQFATIASGGAQTPWTANENGAGFALTNLGALIVSNAVILSESVSNNLTVSNANFLTTTTSNAAIFLGNVTLGANGGSTSGFVPTATDSAGHFTWQSASSASQTPVTQNINGGAFNLTNLAGLQANFATNAALIVSNLLTGSNATFIAVTSSNGFIGAATSATNLTGTLAGDVTGTQGATVVSSVDAAALPAAQITGTVATNNLPANLAALAQNNALQLTNYPSGWRSALDYGVKGDGSTDDTLAISNALAAGTNVYFPQTGAFYLMSQTVYPTNNTYMWMQNSRLVFKAGSTGTMISVATNCTNVILDGVWLDGVKDQFTGGGDFANGDGSGAHPWNNLSGSNPFTNMIVEKVTAERHGILFSSTQTNSMIRNLRVDNLAGIGLTLQGNQGTFPQPRNLSTVFAHLRFNNDWMGVSATNNGEYANLVDVDGSACGIVINKASGNFNLTGGMFTRNGQAFLVAGGANPAHGLNRDITINHCDIAAVLANSGNGELFVGCSIIGGGGGGVTSGMIQITNFTGFCWTSGYYAGTHISVDAGANTTAGPNSMSGMGINVPAINYANGGELDFEIHNDAAGANPKVTNSIYQQNFLQLVAMPGGSTNSNLGASGNTVLNTTTNLGTFTSLGVITGPGSGLTALNGSSVSSGTVAAARLPSDVAYQDLWNDFTGPSNTFTGPLDIRASGTNSGAWTMLSTLNVAGVITGPGSGLTSLAAGNVSTGTLSTNVIPVDAIVASWTNQSSAFTGVNGGTNFIYNGASAAAKNIMSHLTNDDCIVGFTNGPGPIAITVDCVGATNHNLLFPALWRLIGATNFVSAVKGTNDLVVITNTEVLSLVIKARDGSANPTATNTDFYLGGSAN